MWFPDATHWNVFTSQFPLICVKSACVYGAGHQRIHSEEKPFVCTFDGCNKSFRQASDRSAHMRVHSGVKPYVCEDCGQQFSQSSGLRRHRSRTVVNGVLICTDLYW